MMRRFNVDNFEERRELLRQKPVETATEIYPRRTLYGSDEARAIGLQPLGEVPDVVVPEGQFEQTLAYAHNWQMLPMYWQNHTWGPPGFTWNQDGLGYCHTEDTEVLTDTGWVGWGDVTESHLLGTIHPTTHAMEFQAPLARQVFEYNGPMVHSTNRRIDFGVTPNHRMLVRKWDESIRTLSPNYEFTHAGSFGWYCGLMHAPSGWRGTELVELEIPGDRRYDGDDFVAMLAMIISDGYAGGMSNRKTRNHVSFACFNESHRDRVAALAHRVGFREQPSRPGVFYRWDAGALAEWLRVHCYDGVQHASGKRVPGLIKQLSQRQISLFLTWYHDQLHKSPMTQYFTTSATCAGDIQELLLRIGKRATFSWDTNGKHHPLCTVCVSKTSRLCLDKKKHIETDSYRGNVFCATVPNGTLITRRNGSVLISGNCWTWGGTACLMDARAAERKDTTLLAPVSMGWLVNWQNRGNYLEDFIRGAREKGIAPAECVPDSAWHSPNPNAFDPCWETERANYRLDQVWDCDSRRMEQHCLSILAYGRPLYIAYNWWGHALEMVGMRYDGDTLVKIIRNSHNEDDFIELEGRRSVPDEAYGFINTVTP